MASGCRPYDSTKAATPDNEPDVRGSGTDSTKVLAELCSLERALPVISHGRKAVGLVVGLRKIGIECCMNAEAMLLHFRVIEL